MASFTKQKLSWNVNAKTIKFRAVLKAFFIES